MKTMKTDKLRRDLTIVRDHRIEELMFNAKLLLNFHLTSVGALSACDFYTWLTLLVFEVWFEDGFKLLPYFNFIKSECKY